MTSVSLCLEDRNLLACTIRREVRALCSHKACIVLGLVCVWIGECCRLLPLQRVSCARRAVVPCVVQPLTWIHQVVFGPPQLGIARCGPHRLPGHCDDRTCLACIPAHSLSELDVEPLQHTIHDLVVVPPIRLGANHDVRVSCRKTIPTKH